MNIEKSISTYKSDIYQEFYEYLINSGKTINTAKNYVNNVKNICKEYNMVVENLGIDNLIGMYSPGGIKSEENKRKHGAPLSALKEVRDFMYRLYLCYTEGYQSSEIMDEHPSIIEIEGRNCSITFKKNRVISKTITKVINKDNYYRLLNVFIRYKHILSQSKIPSIQAFPHGGVHSYSYSFEEMENYSGCASLFESSDRRLVEKAYEEYYTAINKIINQ